MMLSLDEAPAGQRRDHVRLGWRGLQDRRVAAGGGGCWQAAGSSGVPGRTQWDVVSIGGHGSCGHDGHQEPHLYTAPTWPVRCPFSLVLGKTD